MLYHHLSENLLHMHAYIKNYLAKTFAMSRGRSSWMPLLLCHEQSGWWLRAAAVREVSPWVRAAFCQLTNSCGNTRQLCLENFVVQMRPEEMRLSGSKATSHTGRAKCFQPPFLIPDHFHACAHALFVLLRLSVELNNKPEQRADPTLKALLLPSPFFLFLRTCC